MKQINKKHKWLACLLAMVMLIGVIEPFGIVKAEGAINAGNLTLKSAYATGTNQYTALLVEFQSQTAISLPETGKLTAVEGSGDILRNGTSVLGKLNFTVTNATGGFKIDGIEGTGSWPQVTETFAIKGQFTLPNGTVVEFPETTFQYMGTNANGYGYWRDYTKTVESGALVLASESLNGTNQYGWGGFRFTVTNGYAPAPRGINTQKFQSIGGTITKKTDQNAEEVALIPGSTVNLKSGDTDRTRKYYIEDCGSFQPGNIITIQGTFKTADGFSINIVKTAFKYEGSNKWSLYKDVRESGDITFDQNGKITSSAAVYFKPANANAVPFTSQVQLYPVAGSGKIMQNGQDALAKGVGLFAYGDGRNAIWGISTVEGTEIVLEGDFAPQGDDTLVIRYPRLVFKVIKTSDGSLKWVQNSVDNYVESGNVTVHDNSASEKTSATDQIYFQTDDTSLSKNTAGDGWLRPYEGTILYNGTDITGRTGEDTGAKIFSYSNGVYLIYTLRGAQNGTTLTIQGSFSMADGSIGIDFQPVTFKYVLPENAEKGYWATEGMSFTSDKYLQVENAYEAEILKYEATVRLSKTATNNGGVILGNRDGSGDAYTLGVTNQGAPYLKLKDGNNEVAYQFNSNVCTNDWVKISIVRDGSNVHYYENDVLKESLTEQSVVSVLPTAEAVIGGDYSKDNANYFKGSIRDVKLYADVNGEQLIASYDMSTVEKNTKILSDHNDAKDYDATLSLRWLDTAPEIGQYEYSFAVVGDTQAINDKNGNKNGTQLSGIYDYILENVEQKNIEFVFGLGDITENDDATEWERAQAQIQRLDNVVPYALNRGNHDSNAKMNQYFSYEQYKAKYSGSANGKIENTCQFLSVGKVDYLIFSLDFGASDDVLNWAAGIIETHPNYNVIITTHSYLTRDGKYTTRDNDTSLQNAANTGEDIWNKLVKKYDNVVMVISGHVYANDIIVNDAVGDHGNKIKQIVVNPQVADAMTDGGTGMIAMLYFSADGKNVQVEYYSTVRKQWLADTNQFSMTLDVVEHVDAVTSAPYDYNTFMTYRTEGAYTVPTKEGYRFAGWFLDAECKEPFMQGASADTNATYYAKFVDQYALTVKRQVLEGTTAQSEKTDLRVVTTLDSLDYEEVGFRVTFEGVKTIETTFQTAYKTLYAAGVAYKPDIFSAASEYFATLVIKNIPVLTLGADSKVSVQAFWVTHDGTTVTSEIDTKNLLPTN